MNFKKIIECDQNLNYIYSFFAEFKDCNDLDEICKIYDMPKILNKKYQINCILDEIIYNFLNLNNRLIFYDIVIDKIRYLYTTKMHYLYSILDISKVCVDIYNNFKIDIINDTTTKTTTKHEFEENFQKKIIEVLIQLVKVFGVSINSYIHDFIKLLSTNVTNSKYDIESNYTKHNTEHIKVIEGYLRKFLVHPKTIDIITCIVNIDELPNNIDRLNNLVKEYSIRSKNVELYNELSPILVRENVNNLKLIGGFINVITMILFSNSDCTNNVSHTNLNLIIPYIHLITSFLFKRIGEKAKDIIREVVEIFYLVLTEKLNVQINDCNFEEVKNVTMKKIKTFKKQQQQYILNKKNKTEKVNCDNIKTTRRNKRPNCIDGNSNFVIEKGKRTRIA